MAGIKRNNTVARVSVVLASVVAGFGIWTTVTRVPPPPVSAAPEPEVTTPALIVAPNFSANDNFLSQPDISPVPPAPSTPSYVSQSTPVQKTPVQTAPKPRLRTRGS